MTTTTTTTTTTELQFVPFQSVVDVGFWQVLADTKLNKWKLTEGPFSVRGWYEGGSPQFHIESTALEDDQWEWEWNQVYDKGVLYVFNSLETFRTINTRELLEQTANDNTKTFVLLTHIDLKRHVYTYWFGFPAWVNPGQRLTLVKYKTFSGNSHPILNMCRCVNEWDNWNCEGKDYQILNYHDPSNVDDAPGWPLRNYIYNRPLEPLDDIKVLCIRKMEHHPEADYDFEKYSFKAMVFDIHVDHDVAATDRKPYVVVGWERNSLGNLGPRVVSLKNHLDPAHLAQSMCLLNVRLMGWRAFPQLNMERITAARCLILGAGTLGCNVARCLMGWGVSKFTFVDNSLVAGSNCVRQSLYTIDDVGQPKATAATNAVKRILPIANTAVGVHLRIPMPGVVVDDCDADESEAIDELNHLIASHDVVFLLTDTRESRWLPTVLALRRRGVMVINAALGLETFMVMRCARLNDPQPEALADMNELGCYFCSDVVAPRDSMKDRSMDQQCTISRPGLSYMASALAVEMFIATLHDQPTPHQIRGGVLTPWTSCNVPAFPNCVACSPKVLRVDADGAAEGVDGVDLEKCLRDPNYLETISGVAESRASRDAVAEAAEAAVVSDDFVLP